MRAKCHIKGDIAEALAQQKFLQEGKMVFKNVSQHGPADFITVDKDGNKELLDIKSISIRKRDNFLIHRSPTQLQKKLKVKILYIATEDSSSYKKGDIFYNHHEKDKQV